MITKVCGRCRTELPTSAFGSNRSTRDGLTWWCKPCSVAYYKAKRDDPAYRVLLAERARRRRERPEVKAKISIYDAEYRLRFPEKRRAFDSDPAKKAKDKARSSTPRGRELRRLTEQRRRARLRGSDASLTVAEWDAIKDRFQHLCCYCLAPGALTVEHIVPISQGGAHSVENVVPACLRCNQRKNARGLLQAVPYLMRSS